MLSFFFKQIILLQVKSLKWNPLSIELRQNINTTAALAKNIRAGQPKISVRQNKPLTYEESQYPYLIGVTKSWNSWNTCKYL